jgi:deazaflavin-dependent oxidoreductase (nitroreductase family)
MSAFARRVPPWAVVHNVGRKSGRPYRTPVVAFAGRGADGGALTGSPLPFGPDVDWCRNIRAAGSYTLTHRNRDYFVDELRLVDADEAIRLFGFGARLARRTFRPGQWIVGRLRPAPPPGV